MLKGPTVMLIACLFYLYLPKVRICSIWKLLMCRHSGALKIAYGLCFWIVAGPAGLQNKTKDLIWPASWVDAAPTGNAWPVLRDTGKPGKKQLKNTAGLTALHYGQRLHSCTGKSPRNWNQQWMTEAIKRWNLPAVIPQPECFQGHWWSPSTRCNPINGWG